MWDYCTTEEETTNKSKKVAWFTFEDNDFADKVELFLSNRELIQEDGKWFVVKKKKEYPKTYKECCKVLGIDVRDLDILDNMLDTSEIIYRKNLDRLLNSFRKLLICRDAYWKIAGEEMGLGKPWEPDYIDKENMEYSYYIFYDGNNFQKGFGYSNIIHRILMFPLEEMRDAFYENFKELINECKELL